MAEVPRAITALALAVVWFVVLGALTYWAGEFKLLPGERKQLAQSLLGGTALALALIFVVQALPPEAESVVVPLSVLASLMLLPYARRYVDRKVSERPPEERAELERRRAFTRKPLWFIGFGAGSLIVAILFTLIVD
jgi:hypothetical protein